MNFWILCNFLQNQAQQNEEAQNAVEKLSIEIDRNQQLQQEQLATLEKKMQLKMELQMLQSVAEQLEEERQQHNTMVNTLSVAHQNSLDLCEQLKRVDLQKLAGYEVFVNDMQRQREQKEMEEMFRQRQDMCRKMENRHIVQQLRSKQSELLAATKELQKVENHSRSAHAQANKKLETAQNQRIDVILSLVKGAKQLENLQEEIKSVSNQNEKLEQLQVKKLELTEQLRKLQEQVPLSQQSNSNCITQTIDRSPTVQSTQTLTNKVDVSPKLLTPPTFDPYNPMDFIKSLDIKFDIDKAMQEFYHDLEAEKQKPQIISSEPTHNLRPILRQSNQAKDSNLETTTPENVTRHVQFVEPTASSTTSSGSPGPSMEDIDDNTSSDENKMSFNASNTENVDDDEQHDQSATEMEAESMVCLTLSSEISPAQTAKTNLLAAGTETRSEPVEILECKIVKPAGTAIPKTLPVCITPSPTKVDELPMAETVERMATPPIKQLATNKLFKSPINVLNTTIDTKTTIKNALDAFLNQPRQSTSDSEQSATVNMRGKRSKSIDFDSYCLSNISPASEDEDAVSALAPASLSNDNGTMLFDFGGSTEQLESDEALNFSDTDFQSGPRTICDFF